MTATLPLGLTCTGATGDPGLALQASVERLMVAWSLASWIDPTT
jgi:hypothetical protein